MILTGQTLTGIQAAVDLAYRREKAGDLHAAHLYVLEAQKLLLVAQAKLAETAIFPGAET